MKVGKKTPLTLAYFLFDGNGEVLSDDRLPVNLTGQWRDEEENHDTSFPSYGCMVKERSTDAGESRYSWTVDFAARRQKAR